MKIITTSIEGILIIEPKTFKDNRGFFMETYNQKRYNTSGINATFVQDNLSYSLKNTLRGLHFQIKHPQAKLIQVISGEIFDVAVDLRSGSATFGKWTGIHLSDENKRQMYIPKGFAHGFCVLSEFALFHYKCSDFYVPEDEGGLIWSDPDIGIEWPVENPIISEKDNQFQKLFDLTAEKLPSF
ncbi:MAG: dTDP-4-dehydrorhamnose 3,5-epimerase [Desulfobacterales bacterium]|jgi:dTDP-4-dehydrorhamnose 3,5-epimerase